MTTNASSVLDSLTPASRSLFVDLVTDSFNWSGMPRINTTRELRGNLTDLKRSGLVKTEIYDGFTWCSFTLLGREAALSLGYELL